MKQRQMTAIAVACGIACAACVALFMMSVQGEAEAARAEVLARYGGEQVEACIATRDIVAGERVDLSAIETRLWVADLLPDGAVRSTADAVGKTATSPIFKGEVITAGRFEAGRDTFDVPLGKQAVSVPAKAVQAVGGAIRAGMSVDVYSSGDTSTEAIARNVNVLDTSVGTATALSSGDNGWITLAVEPERVQELIAASNRTTLYFTLPGEPVSEASAASEDDAEAPDESGEVVADASEDAAAEAPVSGDAASAQESADSTASHAGSGRASASSSATAASTGWRKSAGGDE